MKHIQLTLIGLILVLTGLWAAADSVWFEAFAIFNFRTSMLNYTGILAIGAMSVGMLLALRPRGRIESFLGGLDKSYRLHKWLGITALVTAIAHWLWVEGVKWAVGWGWLERPARKGARPVYEGLQGWLAGQRGLAEDVGEWAFYAALVLIGLALIKRFPYRYFFKTHRWLAVVYLVLVYHSVVLMKFSYWTQGIGPVMAVLLAGGTVAAFVSLTRRVGQTRRTVAVVDEVEYHADNRVLRVAVSLQGNWPGHQAGQFAFVTLDPHEGPHPFTMPSAWKGDGKMFFLIKALGDYTNTLPATVKVGDAVQVEGPYGRFSFKGRHPRQIWVAGGIGITPFIARMQALCEQPDGKAIDLFYSTSAPDAEFIRRLRQRAEQAGVTLHVVIAAEQGRLTPQRIRELAPGWAEASVWFCGPAGFGQSLREDWVAQGRSPDDFHQELFEMR